jgi:hypothetical protein
MLRRFLLALPLLAATAATPALAQGCDTSFEVVNRSNRTVQELYFSSANRDDWGRDRLGENVLPSGRRVSFRPPAGGNYDFKVVWDNGRSAELRNVNVCSASIITVGNNGLSAD